jgi:hypothetical protein
MLENKIMFLILALLIIYVVFTQKGQEYLKKYLGISITQK